MWKDFFYYSKAERRVILFLFFMALCLIGIGLYWPEKRSASQFSQVDNCLIDSFLAGVKTVPHAEDKEVLSESGNGEIKKERLRSFDPNTVDFFTLKDFGLSDFVARNILRYREKGGVFRNEASFSRIYGLTDEQFNALRPYIIIKKSIREEKSAELMEERKPVFVSEKYPEGTVIDLNKADTSALKRLRYRLSAPGNHDVPGNLSHPPDNPTTNKIRSVGIVYVFRHDRFA